MTHNGIERDGEPSPQAATDAALGQNNIVICRRGDLRPASRKRLEALGYVVIESENPDSVRFVGSSEIPASTLSWAAIGAISRCNNISAARDEFIKLVFTSMPKPSAASKGASPQAQKPA